VAILEAPVIGRLLTHLGLQAWAPPQAPARGHLSVPMVAHGKVLRVAPDLYQCRDRSIFWIHLMPMNFRSRLRALLIAGSLALIMLPGAQLAHAQFLPGAGVSNEKSGNSLDLLLEEARKDGSTVIVVRPGQDAAAAGASDAGETLETRVLKARARVERIMLDVSQLLPNIQQTLAGTSPEGGYFWLVRAVATALLGFLVGGFVIGRIQKSGVEYFRYMWNPDPKTTADKAKYLLFRVVLAFAYAAVLFLMIMAVVVIFDPVLPASRRLVFEVALAFVVLRLMRRAVSWNLFAYDAPSHRLVNLDDDEAIRIARNWNIAVAVLLVFTASARFLIFAGQEQPNAGLSGENVLFLQICLAALFIVVNAIFTLAHWRSLQRMFAPRSPSAWMYQLRTALATFVPGLFLLYSVVAFVVFVYRLALDEPNPGLVIGAPFVILFASTCAYWLVLIIIQWAYNRRTLRFQELAAAERARSALEASKAGEGDAKVPSPRAGSFEYQPMFRSLFENAALAIIGTIALRQLGQIWGADMARPGNPWSAFLTIVLAGILCALVYRAMVIFIDNRIAEEAGDPPENEDELASEGGGLGESRMATLLPILRYITVIMVFSITAMVILSTVGFDIGPIFAGAGVVGIAVGFGAQTLIRDIFSGAFFLMDDAFRKGEYVSIGSVKGTVEKISMRSFQLRHHLGPLHTVPFGEVKQLTNYSRDWVVTKLPLRVTYDTDVEKVRKLIKNLGQSLLEHPQIGHTFMEPLKSQGVYSMEDSAMIIRVKFMTKPGEQFAIRKIVYESIQDLFTKEGIHFAHKEVTVRLADGGKVDDLTDKQQLAVSSAARSIIDAERAGPAASGER
jgi:small-conductance mechanosensitive channel